MILSTSFILPPKLTNSIFPLEESRKPNPLMARQDIYTVLNKYLSVLAHLPQNFVTAPEKTN